MVGHLVFHGLGIGGEAHRPVAHCEAIERDLGRVVACRIDARVDAPHGDHAALGENGDVRAALEEPLVVVGIAIVETDGVPQIRVLNKDFRATNADLT